MSKRLSMRKIREILRLRFDLGRTCREIATSVCVGNSTVCDCLKRAKAARLSWPLPVEYSDEKLESMLYTPNRNNVAATLKKIDFAHVHQELKRNGVTKYLLWLEYKDQNLGGLGYSRFCDLYRQWSQTIDLPMRQIHKLGEKLFIDYAGMTIPIHVNSKTGETINAQIFVAVLGASGYVFVEATLSQSLPDWIGSHVRAFSFFGGVPEILVPDNLKSGVISPHLYEPDVNPTYQDMAEHYGVAVIPARVRKPKDKAKAEEAVQHAERRILARLRNHRFFSLSEVNAAIKPLLDEINRKPFQQLSGSRLIQFENQEKALLRPLPSIPYEFAEWKKAMVNIDYHLSLNHHHYSVPFIYVKKQINIRYTTTVIEVFYKACLEGYSSTYHRLPRLLPELIITKGIGTYTKTLNTLSKTDVLILDDWGLISMTAEHRRDLLEMLDDRHDSRSTIVTSQLPIKHWHEAINDNTLADAILDRLVHNAHRIELKGESMRKINAKRASKKEEENT